MGFAGNEDTCPHVLASKGQSTKHFFVAEKGKQSWLEEFFDLIANQPEYIQAFIVDLKDKPSSLTYILTQAFISRLCGSVYDPVCVQQTLSFLSKEQVRARIHKHYRAIGLAVDKIHEYFVNSRWQTACLHTITPNTMAQPKLFFEKNLANPDFRQALVINEYEGIEWFNKEAFETMLWNLKMIPGIECLANKCCEEKEKEAYLANLASLIDCFRKAEIESGYRIDRFIEALSRD